MRNFRALSPDNWTNDSNQTKYCREEGEENRVQGVKAIANQFPTRVVKFRVHWSCNAPATQRLNNFQFRRVDLYGGGLGDEIQAKEHERRSRALFNRAFQSAQRTGLDPHPTAGGNLRRQADL